MTKQKQTHEVHRKQNRLQQERRNPGTAGCPFGKKKKKNETVDGKHTTILFTCKRV